MTTQGHELSGIDATVIECPTCGAWKGWACEGNNYGYHAAGYHAARYKAAKQALVPAKEKR